MIDDEAIVRYKKDGPIVVGTIHSSSMLDASKVTQFGDQVVAFIGRHSRLYLLLDFTNVGYLSSATLTELIRIKETAEKDKGLLRLCNLSKDIYEVFKITSLDEHFSVHQGEDLELTLLRFKRIVERATEDSTWRKGIFRKR